MEYFNWTCAYSGKTIGRRTKTVDHIISLNKNGLNEIWNCVPAYKNYNSSKQDSNPIEWYIKQDFYDEDRLMDIIEWQLYAYEKWATESNQLPKELSNEIFRNHIRQYCLSSNSMRKHFCIN